MKLRALSLCVFACTACGFDIDDFFDQLIEFLLGIVRIAPVLAEQALQRFIGEHAAVEDRLHDRIVQRLP